MVPADAACVTRGPPRHCSATLLAPGTRASCLFLRLSSLGQAKVTVARASWDNPPERQTRVPQGGAFRYQEETLELPAWGTAEELARLLRRTICAALDSTHVFPVIKVNSSTKLPRGLGEGLTAALGRSAYSYTPTDGILGRWLDLGGIDSPNFYRAAHQKAAKLGFGEPLGAYAEADQDSYMLRLAVANVMGDRFTASPAAESEPVIASLRKPELPANAELAALQRHVSEQEQRMAELEARVRRLEPRPPAPRSSLWLAQQLLMLFVLVLATMFGAALASAWGLHATWGVLSTCPATNATAALPGATLLPGLPQPLTC